MVGDDQYIHCNIIIIYNYGPFSPFLGVADWIIIKNGAKHSFFSCSRILWYFEGVRRQLSTWSIFKGTRKGRREKSVGFVIMSHTWCELCSFSAVKKLEQIFFKDRLKHLLLSRSDLALSNSWQVRIQQRHFVFIIQRSESRADFGEIITGRVPVSRKLSAKLRSNLHKHCNRPFTKLVITGLAQS